jgi:AcrR family transcriptional regulator
MPNLPALADSQAQPDKHHRRPQAARGALAIRKAPAPDRGQAQRILAAALGLFSRFGLHGTSVDQVAARADVSKSNLLYYFANKEELYVCVLRDLLAVWLEPLRALQRGTGPARSHRRLHPPQAGDLARPARCIAPVLPRDDPGRTVAARRTQTANCAIWWSASRR